MKKISKIIKGLLLTAVAISIFALDLSPMANKVNNNIPVFKNAQELTLVNTGNTAKLRFSDYFLNKTFAQAQPGDPNYINPDPSAGTDYLLVQADEEAASTSKALVDDNPGSESPTEAHTSMLSPEARKKIADATRFIFGMFHPFVYFFTKHISNLMGTDLIFGGKMGEMLQSIWVVSRNIVNIAFVLILLYYAMIYIFAKEDKTDLKKILPAFAFMLIAVNFSWLASKLIVDAANVATNIAFSIPSGIKPITGEIKTCTITDNSTNANCSLSSFYIPMDADKITNTKDCGPAEAGYKEAYTDGKLTKPNSPFAKKMTLCWGDLDMAKFDKSNAAYHLTYSMAMVQNLTNTQTDISSLIDMTKIGLHTLFALFIMVIYLIAFGTLAIVLLFRMAILWVFVAFSPFLVLLMFLKTSGLEKIAGGIGDKYGIGMFIKWTFAPVKVAAIWSIGFIMISTGQTATADIFAKLNAQSTVITKEYVTNALFGSIGSFEQLIWLLMTMMIIWMGTFAVFADLEGAQLITNQIRDRGKGLFKAVAKTPMVAPIFPTIDLKKGGLDWSNRQSLSGATDLESKWMGLIGAKHGEGYVTDSKMTESERKFREIKDIRPLTEAVDDNKKAETFSGMSGFNMKQIEKMDEPKLIKYLEGHSKIDEKTAKELAAAIKRGSLPGTAATPASPTASQPITAAQTQEAVRRGVEDALKRENFDESKKDQIINEVEKMRQVAQNNNQQLDIPQVTKEVIEKLKAKPEPEGSGQSSSKNS